MKKNIIISILAIILLIAPIFVVTASVIVTPCQYDQTFLGELADKHNRLKSIKEEKIVLIGGSSMAFGLDSKKMEEYLGKPVVNYGLYATIGTKAMLDMSQRYVNKGDIVVICPETDKQTYSLYYNGHSMWQAIDCDLDLLNDVGFSNYGKLIAKIPEFANEKLGFIRKNQKPQPTGIYAKASFNEYGDIKVDRPFNQMPNGYDTLMPISLTTDLLDSEFIDYLNKYAKKCERKGATVYFGFSPINADSVVSTAEEQTEFYNALGEKLNFPILSDINNYIMDSAFFYDTNFHLNSTGALERTSLLADDLAKVMGKTITTQKYDPPKRPDDYYSSYFETDENAKYFEFEESTDGFAIVGLTKAGQSQKVLTIPQSNKEKPVLVIEDNAFAKSKVLEHIIIKEDANLKSITPDSLKGCPTLRIIENYRDPEALPFNTSAVANMPSECFVYIPADNYPLFATDYFWSGMMRYVKTIDEMP
jgi:hypothetical protein